MGLKPIGIWMTGLSGEGKLTLFASVEARIARSGVLQRILPQSMDVELSSAC